MDAPEQPTHQSSSGTEPPAHGCEVHEAANDPSNVYIPDLGSAMFLAGRDGASKALTVDVELFEHYLSDSDLNEAQKQELLQTLWEIICEFVAMGFGVHPVQQAAKNCGQLSDTSTRPTALAHDGVKSKDIPSTMPASRSKVPATNAEGGRSPHE